MMNLMLFSIQPVVFGGVSNSLLQEAAVKQKQSAAVSSSEAEAVKQQQQ